MGNLTLWIYAAFMVWVSLRPMGTASIAPWDKLYHLIFYAIFALLAYQSSTGKKHYLYTCLGIIAFGGLLEIGQSFMPGRMMSAGDFLANTLGVALGAAVANSLSNNGNKQA